MTHFALRNKCPLTLSSMNNFTMENVLQTVLYLVLVFLMNVFSIIVAIDVITECA